MMNFLKNSPTDPYTKAVAKAVKSARKENTLRLSFSIARLLQLPGEDVLAELFNWVEDEIKGKDVEKLVEKLLETTTVPLPPDPKAIIVAVENNDLRAAHSYAKGDLKNLIIRLVMLIASLQEVNERN